MTPGLPLDSTTCLRLVLTLGHFLWQGAAIAVLAAALAWLLRRSTAQARYTVMVGALLLMAACPLATFFLVRVPVETPAVLAPVEPIGVGPGEITPTMPEARGDSRLAVPDGEPEVENPAASRIAVETQTPGRVDWRGWRRFAPHMAAAYFVGVALMLGRLLASLRGGRRLRKAAQRVDDPDLLAILAERAKRLGLRAVPLVAYCGRVAAPTVIGVLRPIILLPFSLASGLTPDQVAAILTHELAHIRRLDPLANLAQRVIEAVLFFHPVVWLVSRRIRIERENCCDDLVVAAGGEPFAYAASLVELA